MAMKPNIDTLWPFKENMSIPGLKHLYYVIGPIPHLLGSVFKSRSA